MGRTTVTHRATQLVLMVVLVVAAAPHVAPHVPPVMPLPLTLHPRTDMVVSVHVLPRPTRHPSPLVQLQLTHLHVLHHLQHQPTATPAQ
jgi:hypothetical protein